MDIKLVAALIQIVSNYLLEGKRRSARRLKLLKEQRNRRRRAFLQRQAIYGAFDVRVVDVGGFFQSNTRELSLHKLQYYTNVYSTENKQLNVSLF